MKHLILGIGILLLCLALCLTVNAVLGRYTEHMAGLLEEALDAGRGGDWDEAGSQLEEAAEFWRRHQGFWGVALRHGEVDTADSDLAQLTVLVQTGHEDFSPRAAGARWAQYQR